MQYGISSVIATWAEIRRLKQLFQTKLTGQYSVLGIALSEMQLMYQKNKNMAWAMHTDGLSQAVEDLPDCCVARSRESLQL